MKRKKVIPFNPDSNKIYKPSQVRKVLDLAINETMLIGNNKSTRYYNVPCSFDIETTSFYVDENGHAIDYKTKIKRQKKDSRYEPSKCATMYIWQFGINGYIIVGRTWQEFQKLLIDISDYLQLNKKKMLIVYVHNLGYEFQFMRKQLEWLQDENGKAEIFSIDLRKPIYARTNTFIEFRCSYLLSGYSLENLGKNLLKYKVNKLKGALDYSLLRHSKTKMTKQEIAYCVNDIKVVMSYIQEEIENNKGIQNLPLTKTGRVRKYCRDRCFNIPNVKNKKKNRNLKFIQNINDLRIRSIDEFNTLKRAFMGGFTHANQWYVGDLLENVSSYDFTSSYPYVMVSEKFPMGKALKVEITEENFDTFINSYDKYLSVFDVEFKNLVLVETQDAPLSESKCYVKEGVAKFNGRIIKARRVRTTLTNVDYEVMKKFYKWKEEEIKYAYVYTKDYLPTELVKCILDLYQNKTVLKGVEGQEVNYMQSKEMINSVYGMSVTNPLRDENLYLENKWSKHHNDNIESMKLLKQYNSQRSRFLFYPWGIFVTAYARRNLFTGIEEFKDDYIYSDTDSLKVLNAERHKEYFDRFNNEVNEKLKIACEHHGIDFEMTRPKTKEGKIKPLGIWDFEGTYDYFKTLGAKRYMYSQNGKLSITISGVPKCGADYLDKVSKGNTKKAFKLFNDGLIFPAESINKNVHTYIEDKHDEDKVYSGVMVDYQGTVYTYNERTGTHLEPSDYEMSMFEEFMRVIENETVEIE